MNNKQEVINAKDIRKYSRFKIALGFIIFLEILGIVVISSLEEKEIIRILNKINIWELVIVLVVTMLLLFLQLKYFRKIVGSLIFQNDNPDIKDYDTYMHKILAYRNKVFMISNVECLLTIGLTIFGGISLLYPTVFTGFKTISSVILGLFGVMCTYFFTIEGDLDFIYCKYFQPEYIEYLKENHYRSFIKTNHPQQQIDIKKDLEEIELAVEHIREKIKSLKQ